MGWSYLALQYHLLLPSRLVQVYHPIHPKWKGMGQLPREQGKLLEIIDSDCSRRILSDTIMHVTLQTAFTTKKDYGREEREAQWAMAQRTLHGLQPPETTNLFADKNSYRELSEIAEQAKKRAEVARFVISLNFFDIISRHFAISETVLKIMYVKSLLVRLRELHTLKGHVESVVKLKGLDIDTIQQHYTV